LFSPVVIRFELYYPAFDAAVQAGVGSVMCSYNRVNGTYACENPTALRHLKEVMGFQGWVMSDWGATHKSGGAANAGLDQQMPDGSLFGALLAAEVGASVDSCCVCLTAGVRCKPALCRRTAWTTW
jgi:beta-glucosidase-like glycosyl hydrolase